ncbi:MAG: hypothetical protein JSW07_13460 [bacterium]|nr:MAG: hypothetical protein JSW07_13460 [bacterium]
MEKIKITTNLGRAWIFLSLCIALHVLDEALHDFLSVYNPMVLAIRQRAPFIPFPTFSFELWLSGLIIGVIILFSLSSFAFQERRWIVFLSYFLGIVMVINASSHFVGTIYLGKAMPGVYSSPFLLAAAIYLLWSSRKSHTAHRK